MRMANCFRISVWAYATPAMVGGMCAPEKQRRVGQTRWLPLKLTTTPASRPGEASRPTQAPKRHEPRLGIWMNGWEGLFLAVRRMGWLRAGCEFGAEPAHAPHPRFRRRSGRRP